MGPAPTRSLRRIVVRAARAAPAATTSDIAAAVGCHPSTVRRHLADRLRFGDRAVAVAQSATQATLRRELQRVTAAGLAGPSLAIERALAKKPTRSLAGVRLEGCGWLAERLATDQVWEIRERAVTSRHASSWLLRRAGCGAVKDLQGPATRNPRTPPAALDAAARSQIPGVRVVAALRGAGRLAALVRCAADSTAAVRQAAADSGRLPEPLLGALSNDPSHNVAVSAQRALKRRHSG